MKWDKQYWKEYMRSYYSKNKVTLNNKAKKYREENKERVKKMHAYPLTTYLRNGVV